MAAAAEGYDLVLKVPGISRGWIDPRRRTTPPDQCARPSPPATNTIQQLLGNFALPAGNADESLTLNPTCADDPSPVLLRPPPER